MTPDDADASPHVPDTANPTAAAPSPRSEFRYPLMLDIADRLVVIVGGGAVAARKAGGVFLAGGQRIRCVAPEFKPAFPPNAEKVTGIYEARHLDGAGLVFAATDSAEVNDAVVRDARARGVLVCRADAGDGAAGDFTTPAVLRRSAVTVAVSASSPGLSAMVRDGLADRWDERWSKMADAMLLIRPALTHAGRLSLERRLQVLHDLVTEEALSVLANGGNDALYNWLVEGYPDLVDLKSACGLNRPAGPDHA